MLGTKTVLALHDPTSTRNKNPEVLSKLRACRVNSQFAAPQPGAVWLFHHASASWELTQQALSVIKSPGFLLPVLMGSCRPMTGFVSSTIARVHVAFQPNGNRSSLVERRVEHTDNAPNSG